MTMNGAAPNVEPFPKQEEIYLHFADAQAAARGSGVVYSLCASGPDNWLERGRALADCIGYVVRPAGLADTIDLESDDELAGEGADDGEES